MTQKPRNLQIILNEMFASKDRLTLSDVGHWQEKYPEYRREIIEAYTDWLDMEFFALEGEKDSAVDEAVSDEDKNFIENLLARSRAVSGEPLADLRDEAEKKGVAREDLLTALGVSETLMRKLERRNLKEIPEWVEKKIAEILNLSRESLRAFFALPPALPKAARYKSKHTPQAQPKQSFAEAVRRDPELSAEEKQKLLNWE